MRVTNVLRDPRWQFIGVIVAIAFGLWTVFTYWIEQEIYELKVTALANSSLVQIDEGFSNDIEISYDGRFVDNLSLIEIRLENSGNQPIPSSSYERPIKFQFAQGAEILQASVIESIPDDIDLVINVDLTQKHEATIEPILFNARNYLEPKRLKMQTKE